MPPAASVFLKYYRFYRIVGVKITFINDVPKVNVSYNDASDVTNQYSQPSICIIPDREGSTETCTSEQEWQYIKSNNIKKLRTLTNGQSMTCALRPNVLTMIYESLTNTAYQPTYNTWIRNDDKSVPHYGFKYGIKYKSRRTIALRIVCSMIVQYKDACIDSRISLDNSIAALPYVFDRSAEDDHVQFQGFNDAGGVLVEDDDDVTETDQHIANIPMPNSEV